MDRGKLKRLALAFFTLGDEDYQEIGLLLLLHAYSKPPPQVRGPYNAARSSDVLRNILYDSSERFFKAHIRMSRLCFQHITDLIRHDEVFVQRGIKPQRPVEEQLAVFLMHCAGKIGLHTATDSSIAEGTTYLYCKRVRTAILRIRDQHLSWPNTERRQTLKTEMGDYGFPGCIGILDATLIPLAEMPRKDGYAFFCRKKFYAIVVQAICDHKGIFTHYDMGWPGSVQDTRVFRESAIFRDRSKYFEEDEFILCDKGYPLTKFTIRPFADYDLTNNIEEAYIRRQWNNDLSHLRIAIEHAFGRLKGRFTFLRSAPCRRMKALFKTIEACMVLHNILTELGDDPEEIDGFRGTEDDIVRQARIDVNENVLDNANMHARLSTLDTMTEEQLYLSGLYRRKELLRHKYM